MGRPGPSPLLPTAPTASSRRGGDEWVRRRNLGAGVAVGLLLPTLFPIGHILLFSSLWGDMVNPVDPKTCTNSCWDTVFKGPYESGVASYKHVYFNATWNVGKMWVLTVVGVVFLYETFKHGALLALRGRLRGTMGVLVASSLHSHYYAWWGTWNYWNDDFYAMWAHQLFFSLSELAATLAALANIDARAPTKLLPLVFVANVALFHVATSSLDQFVSNVLTLQGRLHQVLRDVFLMSTDLLQLGVAVYELRRTAAARGTSLRHLLRQKSQLWCIAITTSIMTLYVTLFP